jgi:hypothetical protein
MIKYNSGEELRNFISMYNLCANNREFLKKKYNIIARNE